MNRLIIFCASTVLLVTLAAIGSLQSSPARATALTDGRGTVSFDDDVDFSRDRGRERRITPDLADRIIEIAQEIDPPMAAQLRTICDANPQEFERVARTTGRRLLALADLKERDPHLYELKVIELKNERHMTMLARQIAEARLAGDSSREESIRQELLNAMRLNHAFSIRAREESVKRLEQHLEALRAEIEHDKQNYDSVVDRRMEEEILRAERELAAQSTVAERGR